METCAPALYIKRKGVRYLCFASLGKRLVEAVFIIFCIITINFYPHPVYAMMKKRNWMAGVCGAAVMGLLIAGTGTASAGTIPTGFQVGGFDLSGMTREEADQTIEKSIGEMEIRPFRSG